MAWETELFTTVRVRVSIGFWASSFEEARYTCTVTSPESPKFFKVTATLTALPEWFTTVKICPARKGSRPV